MIGCSPCTATAATPMTSQCTAQLLAQLGVTRSLSRPRASDDNPFSEVQFKTLKYHPGFPARFPDRDAAGPYHLRLAVLAPAAPRNPRIAERRADLAPVRGPVARTAEPGRVDERLGQQHWVAGLRFHVPRQSTQRQAEDPRREIRHATARQHQKPRVVRDQPHTMQLLLARPADQTVAHADLERTRMPAQQRQPRPVRQLRHLADTATDQTTEPKIVVTGHQHILASGLGSTRHHTHRHLRPTPPPDRTRNNQSIDITITADDDRMTA